MPREDAVKPVTDPIRLLMNALQERRGVPFEWTVEWAGDGTIDRAWAASREPMYMVALLEETGATSVRVLIGTLAAKKAAEIVARSQGTCGPLVEAAAAGDWQTAENEVVVGKYGYAFWQIASAMLRPEWSLADAVYELTSRRIGMTQAAVARAVRDAYPAPTLARVMAAAERLRGA